MTLTIELSPRAESWLQERARQRGVHPSAVAQELIEASVPAEAEELSGEEWERLADELARAVDPGVPPLSDHALSRESFYEGRP